MKLKSIGYSLLTFSVVFTNAIPALAANLTTVGSGLNNPVGITFGSDGSLYVAETGTGGNTDRCQTSPFETIEICAGQTSSLTQIDLTNNTQTRVITEFDSTAYQPSQEQGSGIQELAFDSQGNAYFISGYGGYPGNRDLDLFELAEGTELPPQQTIVGLPIEDPTQLLDTPDLGKLFKVNLATQELTEIFDFALYEQLNNLDGSDYNSYPFAIAIQDDSVYVSDAGANVIYTIGLEGELIDAIVAPTQLVEDVEVPPNFPIAGGPLELQAVPTGITVGPDGAVYYGELTGFPFPEGEAKVIRINEAGEPEVFLDGFTQIIDIAFDQEGNLLVLQFADEAQWKNSVNGDLKNLPASAIKVTPDGERMTIASEGIFSATGIQVSPDGEIYITNNAIGTNGSVVRVDDAKSVSEPGTILALFFFGAVVSLKSKESR
ncbi:MAG: ScyD/ScyE family protein [Cyanobacteria bacterium J06592_8]